jgi:hypothetical protein
MIRYSKEELGINESKIPYLVASVTVCCIKLLQSALAVATWPVPFTVPVTARAQLSAAQWVALPADANLRAWRARSKVKEDFIFVVIFEIRKRGGFKLRIRAKRGR